MLHMQLSFNDSIVSSQDKQAILFEKVIQTFAIINMITTLVVVSLSQFKSQSYLPDNNKNSV